MRCSRARRRQSKAALTLLLTRHVLVTLGALALMAGTIVGFLLARSGSIFGFHLTFTTTEAYMVLVVEGSAAVPSPQPPGSSSNAARELIGPLVRDSHGRP